MELQFWCVFVSQTVTTSRSPFEKSVLYTLEDQQAMHDICERRLDFKHGMWLLQKLESITQKRHVSMINLQEASSIPRIA